MGISYVGAGAENYGINSMTPQLHASTASGDMMLLAVYGKPYNAGYSLPGGWTALTRRTDGTVAAGNDAGSMSVQWFYKENTGESGTISVTEGSPAFNSYGSRIITLRKGAGDTWDAPVETGGGDATAGTGFSVTGTDIGDAIGDFLVAMSAIRSDAATPTSFGLGLSWTGIATTNHDTYQTETTVGGDQGNEGFVKEVTTASTSGDPTLSMTLLAAHTGSVSMVRVRVTAGSSENHTLTPSDTITMSDDISKAARPAKADTITLADAAVKSTGTARADTITLTDAAGKSVALPRADTITLSDNANVLLILVLQLSDTITLSDAHAKAAALSKGDTVTLSDNFTRAWAAMRSVADTVTLTDAVSKGIGHALADSISASDAFGSAPQKALADTVTLADATARTYGISRQDAITLTDSATKALGLSRADTVTLSDVIAKVAALSRADTLTLSDDITVDHTPEGGGGLTLNLSDTLTLTDVMVKSLGMSRADIVQLADSTARALNGIFQEGGGDGVDFRTIILNRFGIY